MSEVHFCLHELYCTITVACGAQATLGTIAVLTRTNEEALLVQNMLLQNNIPAKLIAAQDGYSLKQLLELKCFSWFIHDKISADLGFISETDWAQCKNKLESLFENSADLPLALEVISEFEKLYPKRRFWSYWLAFLQEARAEDFVFPEASSVLVSTMHKAKGKEFDHVFLMLRNYPLKNEACKRVVYVAITRAKQSLFIHTDQTYFNHITAPELHHTSDETIYPAPAHMQLELGMKDVWLDFYKRPQVTEQVKAFRSGTALQNAPDDPKGLYCSGRQVVAFSKQFSEKLLKTEMQGYKITYAETAHIVVWFCEDDGKEYRVVLPRLVLEKEVKIVEVADCETSQVFENL